MPACSPRATSKRWAEPGQCATVEALQARFDDQDRLQREEYPHHGDRTRWEVYHPELVHSGRRYSRAWERRNWDIGRVRTHLSSYAVGRRVDQTGNVSVYNRNQYIGSIHGGKLVYVMFDPEGCEWLFTDNAGRELRRRPAPEITAERIVALEVPGNK